EIGTSCRFSTRFCAVTTTSSSPVPSAANVCDATAEQPATTKLVRRSAPIDAFMLSPSSQYRVLSVEVQPQPGARPAALVQSAGRRPGDPCIAHVGAAETNVGDHRIGQRQMLVAAIGFEDGDAAIAQRADAQSAARLECHAVEHLLAGQRAENFGIP